MNMDTFFVPNVAVQGTGMTVHHRGVLMFCVGLPGGGVPESIDGSVDPNDPSKGRFDIDLRPASSVPEERFPDEWVNQEVGNPELAVLTTPNPTTPLACAHIHTDIPEHPESHTAERSVGACVLCLNTEPKHSQ
jgi:hypothetical protein